MSAEINRRQFVTGVAGGLVANTAPAASRRGILNFNENMEYRRLGKTGLMISAVSLGGHWKRVGVMMSGPFRGSGASKEDDQNIHNPELIRNRSDVVSRAIELGINYVDACSPPEILMYSKVLKGRREKMYLGYSWHTREPRFAEWRTSRKLLEGLDDGMKQAGLDYIDLWRISLPMEGVADLGELLRVEEATVEGLEKAKRLGKVRFTGVSSHNRVWLKSVIEQYPQQMEVVLFPYTASSKELPDDSVFDAIRQHDAGVFAIKPFADNALFKGNSSPNSPTAKEDDQRARLAIRYILSNPAITAPIPGLVNTHQVENAARAVMERRKLDRKEKAELDRASAEMWAGLSADHQWLRNWEYV